MTPSKTAKQLLTWLHEYDEQLHHSYTLDLTNCQLSFYLVCEDDPDHGIEHSFRVYTDLAQHLWRHMQQDPTGRVDELRQFLSMHNTIQNLYALPMLKLLRKVA